MAITVTQISASTAALPWMAIEWIQHGKSSVLGIATGATAGLAAITPAAGGVGPLGGLAIGRPRGVQLAEGLLTAAWAAIASFVLLKRSDALVGLRVSEEDERAGLDIARHEERGDNL